MIWSSRSGSASISFISQYRRPYSARVPVTTQIFRFSAMLSHHKIGSCSLHPDPTWEIHDAVFQPLGVGKIIPLAMPVHIQLVHQPPYRAGCDPVVIGEFQKGISLLAVIHDNRVKPIV